MLTMSDRVGRLVRKLFDSQVSFNMQKKRRKVLTCVVLWAV